MMANRMNDRTGEKPEEEWNESMWGEFLWLSVDVSEAVTDVGAPLSHAAIMVRELGIPVVVGRGNATQLLRTGDCISVDGCKGKVTIPYTNK